MASGIAEGTKVIPNTRALKHARSPGKSVLTAALMDYYLKSLTSTRRRGKSKYTRKKKRR